jgi:hypothetical protein
MDILGVITVHLDMILEILCSNQHVCKWSIYILEKDIARCEPIERFAKQSYLIYLYSWLNLLFFYIPLYNIWITKIYLPPLSYCTGRQVISGSFVSSVPKIFHMSFGSMISLYSNVQVADQLPKFRCSNNFF